MKQHLGPILAIVYLAAVLALTVAAFDLREGDIQPPWLLALMAITLPCSLGALFGGYALVHAAANEFFVFYFLICGGVNVAIVNHLIARRRRVNR